MYFSWHILGVKEIGVLLLVVLMVACCSMCLTNARKNPCIIYGDKPGEVGSVSNGSRPSNWDIADWGGGGGGVRFGRLVFCFRFDFERAKDILLARDKFDN